MLSRRKISPQLSLKYSNNGPVSAKDFASFLPWPGNCGGLNILTCGFVTTAAGPCPLIEELQRF